MQAGYPETFSFIEIDMKIIRISRILVVAIIVSYTLILVSILKCTRCTPSAELNITCDNGGHYELGEPFPFLSAEEHEVRKGCQKGTFTDGLHQEEGYDILLQANASRGIICYVWCGQRRFDFKHYLSVLSAINRLNPDSIYFYHECLPVVDNKLYNTWFDDMVSTYPFIQLRQVNNLCNISTSTIVRKIVSETKGVYLNENVIILQPQERLTNERYKGILTMSSPVEGSEEFTKHCKHISVSNTSNIVNEQCIRIVGTFYPNEIWALQSSLGILLREIFYGHSNIQRPSQDFHNLIPNIAHMVWMGGGEMDYLFYLSVLSLIYIAEVDIVYIHGNKPPTGMLWNKIKKESKIRLMHRPLPVFIYGHKVQKYYHISDVMRVDLLLRYGGIYADTDTIFVRPIDTNLRAYDAVGSYGWAKQKPFPDVLNLGVALGKPSSKFWRMVQESMKWFRDNDYTWNGLRQPYKILERNPNLMHVEPHLQVMCHKFKCHPTWRPNYDKESNNHIKQPIDWRTDAYSYHFTTLPPDLVNKQRVLNGKTMFAEMGRFVLQRAGILKSRDNV